MDSTGTPEADQHHCLDEPGEAQVHEATALFGLLSDSTRLRILWALRDGHELNVSALAQRAGVGATAASQHLTKLRLAGLVVTRKHGRRVFYSARGGHLRRLLTEALFHTSHRLTGQPDHE